MCKIKKQRDVQNAKARIALLCDDVRRKKADIIENEIEIKNLREFVAENSKGSE